MHPYAYIKDNLTRVLEACDARASRLGIPTPTLLAVTKSATSEEVRALVEDFGQAAIAENRTSLFCERYDMFSSDTRPEMHLIGSLQTNKVKYIAGKCALIHSLDSLRLAAEIVSNPQKESSAHACSLRSTAEEKKRRVVFSPKRRRGLPLLLRKAFRTWFFPA